MRPLIELGTAATRPTTQIIWLWASLGLMHHLIKVMKRVLQLITPLDPECSGLSQSSSDRPPWWIIVVSTRPSINACSRWRSLLPTWARAFASDRTWYAFDAKQGLIHEWTLSISARYLSSGIKRALTKNYDHCTVCLLSVRDRQRKPILLENDNYFTEYW